MKAMSTVLTIVGAAALCAVAFSAAAAEKLRYDVSKPLVCASFVVHECALDQTCEARTPEAVGLPSLLKVDAKAKKIYDLVSAKPRESSIKAVSHVDGQMVLDGGENGRGWVATINEETGRMTAAVASEAGGFVVFGQCALP
jgi:hypothetical protein